MKRNVLFLLTYVLQNSINLKIARAMRENGHKVFISYYVDDAIKYSQDEVEDFKKDGTLIDLSKSKVYDYHRIIEDTIIENDIDLILQIGCEPLYPWLSHYREKYSKLRIIDVLYNEIGHTLSHFTFENAIDCVCVETKFMYDYVKNSTRKHEKDVEIIENGIDLRNFSPNLIKIKEKNDIVLGFIGRMAHEKNPLGFVSVAESIYKLNRNISFKMYGNGDLSDAVQERISQSTAQNAIEFRGYTENVASALKEIDVLLVPSILDGRPNIIMEANACSVPVIASPVGGIPELIENGKNGYIINMNDVAGISNLISDWLEFPEKINFLKEKSRELAEEKFDQSLMYKRWDLLFNRIF